MAWAVAATAAAPGLRLLLRVRLARGKEVRGRLAERRGIDATPRPAGRLVWLHAASVGETMSILPVLPALAEARADNTGDHRHASRRPSCWHSGWTPRWPAECCTGSRRSMYRAWAARFLDHWRPDVAGFVESELWPNLLAACRARGIPMMLINARLSDRSLARWRRMPGLARLMLGGFAQVQPRSATDAERLRGLGCCRVGEPGDLKLAAPPLPADEAEAATAARDGGGTAGLARRQHASGRGGCDPCRPSRTGGGPSRAADNHCSAPSGARRHASPPPATGRAAKTRRSRAYGSPIRWANWGCWYRLAGIAFVGRSLLAPGGGQNPLEPARLGCAIAVGPHTGNFTDHVAMLRAAGGLTVVRDAGGTGPRGSDGLLRDPARRQAMGEAAAAALQRHGDLPRRTAAALLELLA